MTLVFSTLSSTTASVPKVFGLRDHIPKVKIRLQKNLKKVLLSGTDLKRKFHIGNDIKIFKGRKSVKFNCLGVAKRKTFKKPVLLASLRSQAGLIGLDEHKYRGDIHIVTSAKAGRCDVVQETNMENYISGLLAKEMNAVWPVEALKAQAVAARTYALQKMESGHTRIKAGYETYFDLESSEKHQVGGSFLDTNENTDQASWDTKGEVLTTKGNHKITPIFFHAKCGGQTLTPDQVWQNKVKGYKSVDCPFCYSHGKKDYHQAIDKVRFQKFLSWSIDKGFLDKRITLDLDRTIRVVPHNIFSRSIRIYLGDTIVKLKKSNFRRYFGRVLFPSNNFKISVNNNKLRVFGQGLGHGVGLCQLGALDLAKKGWDYKRILAHYFPEHELKKFY
tara:strand:+ start:52624 stop:53793 length:1170 start_codon:yes stop_codon:yes gene_type:complete